MPEQRIDETMLPTVGRALFTPDIVAVVGASNDVEKLSGRVTKNLRRHFGGSVLAINPKTTDVQGLPTFARIEDVPQHIDLAVIAVPSAAVPAALRSCALKGVHVAVVLAAGFAEVGGDGTRLQEAANEAIAGTSLRVLGPNCLGSASFRSGAVTSFSTLFDNPDLPVGKVAFVSQSGAFGTFILSAAINEGIRFSHFANTGNEMDLNVSDLLRVLVEDDAVGVLVAYMEGVGDGPGLLRAARRARELDKPIVAVKVGRTAEGARAAASHTASLAGEDDVFDAVARRAGLIRVSGMDQVIDMARVFSNGRRAIGRRLTIVTVSGGAGVLMTDAASQHGLEVRPWADEWRERMDAVVPSYGSTRNPIDVTASVISDLDLMKRALRVVDDHPETDMVAIMLGLMDGAAEAITDALVEAYENSDRPFVVVWTGGNGDALRRLRHLGIPAYEDPVRAVEALAALADFSLHGRSSEPGLSRDPSRNDRDTALAIIERAAGEGRQQLDEYEAARVLECYGLHSMPSRVVTTSEDACAAAEDIGYPVAMKILSSTLAHKSDVGGVRLGIVDADGVRESVEALGTVATEHGEQVRLLVQRMAEPGLEMLLGVKHDPVFGPVMAVGFGGVLCEVLDDVALSTVPVTSRGAGQLLRELRGAALFDGHRGDRARDVAALVDAATALSSLVEDLGSRIGEIDVNPLIVGEAGQGAVAVDALVMLAGDADAVADPDHPS